MKEKKSRKILYIVIIAMVILLGEVFGLLILKNRRIQIGELVEKVELAEDNIKETIEDTDVDSKDISMEADVTEGISQDVGMMETTTEIAEVLHTIETVAVGKILNENSIDLYAPEQYFGIYDISEDIYNQINGKSYRENEDISIDDLRYLKVLHYNFDHEIQVGELIVNSDLAGEFIDIFQALFEEEYEINSMYLVDNYWNGDGTSTDTASIEVNNTSAFHYRPITGGSNLSNHAFGRAIDINPQQNPYLVNNGGEFRWFHKNANDYIDRTSGAKHMIDHNDSCYKIFKEHGFTWGGDWEGIVDYQHFEMRND